MMVHGDSQIESNEGDNEMKEETSKDWTVVEPKGQTVITTKALELVNATLEEESMRQAIKLNVHITDMEETGDKTPEEDGKKLCHTLGYAEEDPPPYETM